MNEQAEPSRGQGLWALAGAIPFLLSIGFFAFALRNQIAVTFAIAWPILQIFGYAMTLKLAKGDPAHYLVKAQVLLHWIVLILACAMVFRGGI